jgi:aspartyl-tRNA(Asn)/glutamyl-tRNA(Gln) amidotransferase subunit A
MREQSASELRVGVPRAPFFDLLDADISSAVEEAIRVLSKLVKSVKVVTLPSVNNVTAGLRPELYVFHEEFYKLNAGLYQRRARNLMRDRNIPATEYIRARWELELMRRTIDDAFTDFDLVVFPTHRTPPTTVQEALKIDQSDEPRNPRANSNAYFSATGLPGLSVPCGFTSSGLPIGLEIAGPRFSESRILALAQAFERATDWHKRRPNLTPDMPVPPLETEP